MTDLSPAPRRRRVPGPLAYLGIIAAVLLIITGVSNAYDSPGSNQRTRDTETAEAASWETPSKDPQIERLERDGFTIARGVGIRFLTDVEKQDRSCYYGICTWVKAVAIEGCRSLYVEANILDENSTIVDWTNETASGMRAGDEAILELSNSGRTGGKTFRDTEVSCR